MSETTWKEKLQPAIQADWAEEIDVFERQLQMRKAGKIEEKLFAETRLRRGAYGQRYDNGQRHDGIDTRKLVYPNATLTKGPDTMWDAPGMHRIKIPGGQVTAEQMEVLAALSEEYSDAICHVTTRQDIQLHFVHIEDTPDLMRRLAAVGVTTREACGNSIRNVTACPIAGVCNDEGFDVTPYAKALAFFLLGHPDVQDFGRKFKPAFSGCAQHACGLTTIHDGGYIAKMKDGKRGFKVVIGGGLGAVPYQAETLYEFMPEEELMPVAQAVSRVFARLGEKANRARARIKFLVAKLGIEEFRRLVDEERGKLREDPRWQSYLETAHAFEEQPLHAAKPLGAGPFPAGFDEWRRTNTMPQRQAGYVVATVKLPLGDATADQMRAMAQMARKYTRETVRFTVEQNLIFRWISESDLPALYTELKQIGLGDSGANTISDITSCPGTDTCKLGISASRGLAGELRERLHTIREKLPPEVSALRIKASGCFNSCGQHHIADIGFLGVARKVGRARMPHFQLVIGGQWTENAASYGLAVGAVPSKRVPQVVERVTDAYVKERLPDEGFQAFITRIGKARVRTMLKDLMEPLPSVDEDPELYRDWGDPRLYTTGDMGVGECAGEIVAFVQFGLAAAERVCFEAQLKLDEGQTSAAADLAYKAMLEAAKAITRERFQNLGDDPSEIVREFKTRLVDSQLFRDPFAGDKFAHFLYRAHEQAAGGAFNPEQARQRVQEAQLFIEAAHACVERMDKEAAAATVAGAPAPAECGKRWMPIV
jgi:sulfite reductase (ferredoxin)